MRLQRSDGSKRWYDLKSNDVASAVFAEADTIRSQQKRLRRDLVHFMELYSAGNVAGLGTKMPAERLIDYVIGDIGATRFNMAAALVDTAVSMCAQTPAVPVILTTGGDFGLMRKARKKTQVLQGQMQDIGAPVATRMFEASAKLGTGIAHGYIDHIDGLAKICNVHPLELLVDHADGLYRCPRTTHRWNLRSREELKACYPEAAAAIDAAASPAQDAVTEFFLSQMGRKDSGEMIEVIESHRIATGKKMGGKRVKNGRHTICIKDKVLLDEKYGETELPYEVMRYRERDYGFHGAGIVESCREAQNRVNELIARVQRGQDLASNVVLLNPRGQGVTPIKKSQFTTDIGVVLDYDHIAGPPTVAKWDGTQWDLQEQIDLEFKRALLVEGLSQEQTNGEGAGKGLTSGVAVRAADDVQTRRLVSPIKRFQEACIGVAKLIARLNDQLAERDPQYAVSGRVQQGRATFLQTSRWSELEIPEGNAQVSMMPMSALPTTPQGKWAAVMEWIEAGFVSQQYAMQLLQFPDLDSYADAELAHIDMAQWQVEQLLEAADIYPHPRQLLPMAQDIATKAELKAVTMNAPPEVIDAFERFLTRVEDMIDQATAAAQKEQAEQAARMPQQPGAPVGGPAPAQRAPQAGPAQLVQQPPARPAMAAVV